LGAYFGQDVFFEFGSLAEARRAAVAGFDLADRQSAVMEWIDWNKSIGATNDIRAHLDAYGVDLDFESEAEARHFMNDIYDELILTIRKQDSGWKP